MRRTLVTGGAGFVGTHLVRRLHEAGERVVVLERPGASTAHLPDVEVVCADIRDRPAVKAAVRGVEEVYHLAADPNLWRRDRGGFDAVNHRGARHVLEEAVAAGADRVLHCSTESILTSPTFAGGAVEQLRLREEDMIGPYCLSKFRAEEAAMRLAEQGWPVVVVNPTLPIGPGDRGQSPPTRMTVAALRGKLPAYLDCRLNMIDVRDVAEGMVAAVAKGRPGRRYLLGAHNVRLVDWLARCAAAVGRRPPRLRVPYAVALGYARFSEWWADHVSGRMPEATVTGVHLARHCMHFDPTATLRELGLHPRPLDDSLTDAVAWYRSQGWL